VGPILRELQKLVSARQAGAQLRAGSEQLQAAVLRLSEVLQQEKPVPRSSRASCSACCSSRARADDDGVPLGLAPQRRRGRDARTAATRRRSCGC
jgi:hypothetical protein